MGGIHENYLMTNYNIESHSLLISTLHILTLTWQYVGLFIISHDLHHAEKPNLYQQFLGRLSLICYGGFLLEQFSENIDYITNFLEKLVKIQILMTAIQYYGI